MTNTATALNTYRVGLVGARVSSVEVHATDGGDAVRAARYAHPEATATTTVRRVTGKGTAVRL